MLRFQTTVTAILASALVVPVLIGQGQVDTLRDALSGTKRALEVLKSLEQKLGQDPAGALALVLSATEAPGGSDVQREDRLESLRSEVNLLQMELDALQSPALAGDGAVQDSLGTHAALPRPSSLPSAGVTTGMDDSLRALLTGAPQPRSSVPAAPWAAPRLADPSKARVCFPDTSANPPFPASAPPSARMAP